MAYVYVLKSCKDGKLYVGSTRSTLAARLLKHNCGSIKSTSKRKPFVLLYSEDFHSYTDARKREIYFKSGSGRESLKRILIKRAGTQVAKGGRL